MTQARIDLVGSDAGLQAMLRNSQQAISGFTSSAQSSFAGLGSGIATVRNGVIALAGALLSGFAKSAIDDTVAFNKEALALARTLGISAAEASVLNIALGDIYQDASTLTTAVGKMTKALSEDEDKIKALGVATREQNGNFRNSLSVFDDVMAKLGGFKEGTDRNVEALKIFGKSFQDVLPFIKKTNEVMESAREKAESLGLVLTEQSSKTTGDYRSAMNDVGDVLLGVKNAIAQALMPTLSWLGNWFASIGPGLVLVFKIAIGGLATAFDLLGLAVRIAWETVNAFVATVAEPIRAVGAAFYKMATGDFKGAADEIANIPKVIAGSWVSAFNKINKSGDETGKAIAARFANSGAAMTAPRVGGGNTSTGKLAAKPAAAPAEKEVNRVSDWEAQLSQQKVALQEKSAANGTFIEMTKAQELRYWQDIMATRNLNEKETISLRKKTAEISISIRKDEFDSYLTGLKVQQEAAGKDHATRVLLAEEAYSAIVQKYGQESKEAKKAMGDMLQDRRSLADQQRAIEQNRIEAMRNMQLLEVESLRSEAQFKLELGTITKDELLQQEVDFEQRKFDLQVQALEQRKTMTDPLRDPEAYAQILLQLEELDAQHEQRKNELRQQQALQSTEATRNMLNGLESSWAGTLKGMMTGSLTFAQGLRLMFKSVVDAIVGMLANMVARWLVQQVMQRVMTQISSRSQVAANAAVAGSGAYAATAAIPFVGPALAPAAAASAYAGTMAFQAVIPAAAKGFDIPFGSNPLTQLHQREMVLPADIAEPMREGLSGGRMGGGATYNITAMDARSFAQFLKDNAGALADGMRHAGRRGFS